MLPRNLDPQDRRPASEREQLLPTSANDPQWAMTWQELGQGAPTLAGLARVCSLSLVNPPQRATTLSSEARGILFAARSRGLIEVKGANRAFDAPGRMLAVYVEMEGDRTITFRNKENPLVTIRFLAGFHELCAAGLVMHHIYQEFSLTRAGIDLAQTIAAGEVERMLALGTEQGLYE